MGRDAQGIARSPARLPDGGQAIERAADLGASAVSGISDSLLRALVIQWFTLLPGLGFRGCGGPCFCLFLARFVAF